MIIKNHHTGIIHLPIGTSPKLSAARAKWPEGLRLLPGTNDVDPDLWDLVKGVPVVQSMLKERMPKSGLKMLEVAGERVPEVDLQKLEAAPAMELIEDCIDVALLNKWLSTEKRKPVIAALNHQLKELEVGGEEKKPEGDEGAAKA